MRVYPAWQPLIGRFSRIPFYVRLNIYKMNTPKPTITSPRATINDYLIAMSTQLEIILTRLPQMFCPFQGAFRVETVDEMFP